MEFGQVHFRASSNRSPSAKFDRFAIESTGEILAFSVVAESQRIKQLRAMLHPRNKTVAEIRDAILNDRNGSSWTRNSRLFAGSDGYRLQVHRLQAPQVQAVFLSKKPGFLPIVTEESLWLELSGPRFTTPILREWMPYLEGRLKRDKFLWDSFAFGCQPGLLVATSDDLDKIVSEGVASGALKIPRPTEILPLSESKPLDEIESLEDYLSSYGRILGKRAIEGLSPLHVPDRDPVPSFGDIIAFNPKREPFPAQKHIVASTIKMLDANGSGFLCGEQGVGKTLLGMLTFHEHAKRSRCQGGRNGKYRAVVVCPDHLIEKWKREIEVTIPGAVARTFDGWKNILDIAHSLGGQSDRKVKEGKGGSSKHWPKPDGPEWYILGKNQIKWNPEWKSVVSPRPGYSLNHEGHESSEISRGVSMRLDWIDSEPLLDVQGKKTLDEFGRELQRKIYGHVPACPKCGARAVGRDLEPLTASETEKKQIFCKSRLLSPMADWESGEIGNRQAIAPIPIRYRDLRAGEEVELDEEARTNEDGSVIVLWKKGRYRVDECGEPFWNWTTKPYRYAAAKIIQSKMHRLFHYCCIDEIHEHKSDESGQASASGKIIGSIKNVMAMTGTLIGGRADHLYAMAWRIAGKTLRDEGFQWGKDTDFSEAYGRIDTIVTTTENVESDEIEVSRSTTSMRRAKGGAAKKRKEVRPGIMPTLFGRHLIGSSVFLTLDQMSSSLPKFTEYVGHESSVEQVGDKFWFDAGCTMEATQAEEYYRITGILKAKIKELMKVGQHMKLLSNYLYASLDYPDRPFGWQHDPFLVKAYDAFSAKLRKTAPEMLPLLKVPHVIGYWDDPKSRKLSNWRGVVTPNDCDQGIVYPKEQRLIEICEAHKAIGAQVWVYLQMTNKRDIQDRLKAILANRGFRVGILRSGDVKPRDREAWIEANGHKYDVMISHPQLVSTGLDLFSNKPGGHNYSTLVFYQTGYNSYTLMQAARRAWRIGQLRDCRVYYLYYRDTMQESCIKLMSLKMLGSRSLEGRFSEEGMTAMAGGGSIQMALAKGIADQLNESDIRRGWGKISSRDYAATLAVPSAYAIGSGGITLADDDDDFV